GLVVGFAFDQEPRVQHVGNRDADLAEAYAERLGRFTVDGDAGTVEVDVAADVFQLRPSGREVEYAFVEAPIDLEDTAPVPDVGKIPQVPRELEPGVGDGRGENRTMDPLARGGTDRWGQVGTDKASVGAGQARGRVDPPRPFRRRAILDTGRSGGMVVGEARV